MSEREHGQGPLLTDQSGIALPLSMLVLTVLTSLTLALLGLGATEPTIATNLKRGEAALALAEAGIERGIWALSYPEISPEVKTNPAQDPYNGSRLIGLAPGAFTIAISPGPTAADRVLTAHGYLVRPGVAMPNQPSNLAESDIAAHRVVRVQVKVGSGPGGSGGDNTVGGPAMNLPGALTVAGTVQMAGTSLVNGNDQAQGVPNNCATKAGITIRDRTRLPDGTEVDNTIDLIGNASTVGTPPQQELGYDDFARYQFTASQLAALKALAQQQGTYIRPTSNATYTLELVNGMVFVDTVNGEDPGTPPDPAKLANVKIPGGTASGWLIVMGSVSIDGQATTYNGFIYAHNDLSYRGIGNSAIYGGILTGNVVDSVATVVDSDSTGNAKIYYDCAKIASGGGSFPQDIRDALKRVIVEVAKGSWRELSN